MFLAENNLLDTSILHGDGTTTAAKKGGDIIGYSGHKHQKGEKIVAIVDRYANIIAPFVVAPANKNESILFPSAFQGLKTIAEPGRAKRRREARGSWRFPAERSEC